MRAEELKIGNWVTGLYEPVAIVKTIHEDDLWGGGYYIITEQNKTAIEMVLGIPISEEWLSQFGFKRNIAEDNFVVVSDSTKDGLFTNYHSMQYVKSAYEDECGWFYNNDDSNADCYTVAKIKYVHQLQNLYYALTGEELPRFF